MSPFEFVTVLISIILGLGITQIMSGIADLIHQWEKVKLYWPHMLWVLLVFVLHVQEWWLIWELKEVTTWRLPFFLFEILYPINLFILARILFPAQGNEETIDLKNFYFKSYRKFFLMFIILSSLSAIENIFIHEFGIEGWLVNALLLAVPLIVVLKKWEAEWLHQFLAIVLLAAMVVGIVLNIDEWLVS